MLGGLNFMLRGLPFLYQGQEIGMENTVFTTPEQFDDINTLHEYQVALNAGLAPGEALAAVARVSRDNARTPFQWSSEENAGFSSGTPWLPVNPNYREINLASQRGRPDSVYEFYRQLTALRKSVEWAETVVYGETVPYLAEQKNLMAYFRKGERTLLVAGNFQNEAQSMFLPTTVKEVLINNLNCFDADAGSLRLGPWQFVVLAL